MNFLKLIRFPNLLIIALTQYILQYAILKPFMGNNIGLLKPSLFFLLVLYTMCIAAAGYVINDIEDLEIDLINKPLEKRLMGRIYTINTGWNFYGLLNSISLTIALYLMLVATNFIPLASFPIVVTMLYLYSVRWKCKPLIGNIMVALLCAYTPLIVLWTQMGFDKDIDIYETTTSGLSVGMIFLAYALFAFLSTLFREIIKDLEDIEGDKKNGCRTLPHAYGVQVGKNTALFIGLIFLLTTLGCVWFLSDGIPLEKGGISPLIIFILIIILPIVYALLQLLNAKDKKDFTYLSSLTKWIMLGGLIYIWVVARFYV